MWFKFFHSCSWSFYPPLTCHFSSYFMIYYNYLIIPAYLFGHHLYWTISRTPDEQRKNPPFLLAFPVTCLCSSHRRHADGHRGVWESLCRPWWVENVDHQPLAADPRGWGAGLRELRHGHEGYLQNAKVCSQFIWYLQYRWPLVFQCILCYRPSISKCRRM